MYSFTYDTRYGDYKNFDVIKTSSVLDMVQDVSTRNSEECGFGINKLKDMNVAWLLKGIKIRFDSPLETAQPVTIHTAVKPLKGATSQRGCLIEQNGKVVAKTIADWFLFDTVKLRPTRIPKEMYESYETYAFDDDFFDLTLPKPLDIDEVSYTIKIFNKEIDTNMHLNNTKSAELLMDALPFDHSFKQLSILYKRPAFLGDELEVCLKKLEAGYYVHLQTKEKEICVVGVFED